MQAGAKAEAKQKLMIKGQNLNNLVLYLLTNFSVLVFKRLFSISIVLDGDHNTIVKTSAMFDERLLKFRLELKNHTYHEFYQPTKRIPE